jgi:hypothetical protein
MQINFIVLLNMEINLINHPFPIIALFIISINYPSPLIDIGMAVNYPSFWNDAIYKCLNLGALLFRIGLIDPIM